MATKKASKTAKVLKPKNVYEALFLFQGENIQIPKRGEGTINGRKYNYPLLDDSIFITRPVLQKHGLGVTQIGEGTNLVTKLFHFDSGTEIRSDLPLGSPSSSQDLGSRISYLRRYMYNAVLGLSNEDIDGANGALDTTKPLPPLGVPGALGQTIPPGNNTAGMTAGSPVQPPVASVQNGISASTEFKTDLSSTATQAPRSEFYLNAEQALKAAQSPQALEELTEQIKRSIRLKDDEKTELLAGIKKADTEINGTVHI